ncbi:MAG: zinc ribbon domain-containing protein [Novosphingobium sp.]
MSIVLQKCRSCGTVNYPSREACLSCLGDELDWREVPANGRLLATCSIHRTLEPAFEGLLPLRLGTVVLDCGPQMIVFAAPELTQGAAVRVEAVTSPTGQAAWRACAQEQL